MGILCWNKHEWFFFYYIFGKSVSLRTELQLITVTSQQSCPKTLYLASIILVRTEFEKIRLSVSFRQMIFRWRYFTTTCTINLVSAISIKKEIWINQIIMKLIYVSEKQIRSYTKARKCDRKCQAQIILLNLNVWESSSLQ